MIEAEGGLPPARRRRRKPKESTGRQELPELTLTTVTVIRAYRPFWNDNEASEWLLPAIEDEQVDELMAEALSTLDRALAAEAAATGRPYVRSIGIDDVLAARIGFGDGDQVSDGLFLEAFEIDARGGTGSPRRERMNRTRPLARIAAIIGERDRANACEYLIPRIRSDLQGGRVMSAALMIEIAVKSSIVELDTTLEQPEQAADLERLEELLPELGELTDAVLSEGTAWPGLAESLEEPLGVLERLLRRRRALDQ